MGGFIGEGNNLDSWKRYVYGLRDYIYSTDGYEQRLWTAIKDGYSIFEIQEENASAMYKYVSEDDGDGFFNAIANQNFTIMKGLTHPRGMKYCPFLASYEIWYLLSFDLCMGNSYTTLRPICPYSCECKKIPSTQCPLT